MRWGDMGDMNKTHINHFDNCKCTPTMHSTHHAHTPVLQCVPVPVHASQQQPSEMPLLLCSVLGNGAHNPPTHGTGGWGRVLRGGGRRVWRLHPALWRGWT